MDQDFFELPDAIKEVAQTELNEKPNNRQCHVDTIREWIQRDGEINCRDDIKFILRFLRVCKFNDEKTKRRIRNYTNLRLSHSNWFDWSDENEISAYGIIQSCCYMMNYEGGCLENILVLDAELFDTKIYNVDQMALTITLLMEVQLENPRLQVAGVQLIVNFRAVGLDLISQLTPRFLWRFISFWQFSMPIRIKGVHIINAPSFVNNVITVIKSFLTKKLKDRFFVHKSYASLVKILPPDSVVNVFGGTAGTAKQFSDATLKILEDGKEFYLLESRRYAS